VPRHRDEVEVEPESDPALVTSQLRRRFALDADPSAADRAPGFVEDEPEHGVPTPRPKMPLSCIPRRVVGERELLTLPLDHRAGFLLTHVDGATSLRTLMDISGMTHDETIALVEQLVALSVIRLK